MQFTNLVEQLKAASIALTVTGSAAGAYIAAGLPAPATVQLVNAQISNVNTSLRGLTQLVLEGQREQFETRRYVLRAERYRLEQLKTSGDRIVTELRIATIADELREIEIRDGELRRRIDEIKANKS